MKRIDRCTGYEFEEYLTDLFERLGYRVRRTGKSKDYGADLILYSTNPREKIVVQAKRYSHQVDQAAVREAVSAIGYYKADRAIVVTNSKFTDPATRLAKSNGVELYDRTWLYKAIEKKAGLNKSKTVELQEIDLNYRRIIKGVKITEKELQHEIDEFLFDKGYEIIK